MTGAERGWSGLCSHMSDIGAISCSIINTNKKMKSNIKPHSNVIIIVTAAAFITDDPSDPGPAISSLGIRKGNVLICINRIMHFIND